MTKQTLHLGENKDANQLHGNREADQHLCFHYRDGAFLLLKSKLSSIEPSSVSAQTGWFSRAKAHIEKLIKLWFSFVSDSNCMIWLPLIQQRKH